MSDGTNDGRRGGARSAALVALSVVVLAGAFALYVRLQPEVRSRLGGNDPPMVPGTRPSGEAKGALPPGREPWVIQLREGSETELASRFRAYEYRPRDANVIDVTRPEVQFFLSDGQMLRVTGPEGTVATPEAQGPGLAGGMRGMPMRGRLRDVTIELFDKEGMSNLLGGMEKEVEPILTARVNNAAFDRETFRVYTDSFVENGQTLPGDQVPVIVRGRDYDFDGEGLTILWNERDNRLELLEVAHGGMLAIKHPESLSRPLKGRDDGRGAQRSIPAEPQVILAADRTARTDRGDRSDRAVVTQVPPTSQRHPMMAPPQPAYRVTVQGDVQIDQGQDMSASADTMLIDFRTQEKKSASAVAPAGASPGTTQPAVIGGKTKPASAPSATQPADPIVVRWTGKLQVRPLPASNPVLNPGEGQVHLIGRPVLVRQRSEQLEGRDLVYHTADGSLKLSGAENVTVKMADDRGAEAEAEAIEFLPRSNRAILHGKGKVVQPLAGEQAGQTLKLTWSHQCELYLAGQAGEAMLIERAVIEGDVDVQHPQIQLQSSSLELLLDSSAKAEKRPAESGSPLALGEGKLKSLIADGGVHSQIKDKDKTRIIGARRLEVKTGTTADGQLYAREINAEGDVKMADDEQELTAGSVHAVLAPNDKAEIEDEENPAGAFDLVDFVAKENVHLRNKGTALAEEKSASGQELIAVKKDAGMEIMLVGAPARVINGTNRIEGPRIVATPKLQTVRVEGAGSLQAQMDQKEEKPKPGENAKPKKSAATRPIEVTWDQRVTVDGMANLVEVVGNVVVVSHEEEPGAETVNRGMGKRLLLTLKDAEKKDDPKGPSTKGVADKKEKPAQGVVVEPMDFLKDKSVQLVTLKEEATVHSTQTTPDGAILQQLYLSSDSIQYDPLNKALFVPQAGRLLVESHDPAKKDKDKDKKDKLEQSQGINLVTWQGEMSFELSKLMGMMRGNVVMENHPDGADEKGVLHMEAQKVTAYFEKVKEERLSLQRVVAEEKLLFLAQGARVEGAQRAEYDVIKQIITVRGTEEQPVTVDDVKHGHVSSREVIYDKKNDTLAVHGVAARGASEGR